MPNQLIRREANIEGISLALGQSRPDVTLDSVIDVVVSEGSLATLDEIVSFSQEDFGMKDILTAEITAARQHMPVAADAIDLSIAAAAMIADSNLVKMDGINSVDGSGVVATAVAFNQYVILNSNIPGLDGNISDMEAIKQGDTDNQKFKLYSFNPIVTAGMGDVADNTRITPANAASTMALAQRNKTFVKADTVLSYVFDVKAKSTDVANYAIGRGVTEVTIGDTGIMLNDFDANKQEKKPKRTITLDSGKSVEMVVDYAAGTVTITLEDNATLANGTKLYVTTSLSAEKIGDIRGFVGSDIEDFDYVAFPVTIATKASMMNIRSVNQAVKHGLLPVGLQVAGQKIATELIGRKIDLATQFATLSGSAIDLSQNRGLATTAEAYKLFSVGVDKSAVEILQDSMLTDKVILVGGKGLVDVYNMLSKNTDGLNVRDTNDANTFKFIGYIDGKYPAYYDPRHDTKYPLVDSTGVVSGTPANNVYHTVNVIGSPADPAKRAVISGVGLPIIPIDLKINVDSEQTIALEGKLIVDANKDPKARKLTKQLLFKTHM